MEYYCSRISQLGCYLQVVGSNPCWPRRVPVYHPLRRRQSSLIYGVHEETVQPRAEFLDLGLQQRDRGPDGSLVL